VTLILRLLAIVTLAALLNACAPRQQTYMRWMANHGASQDQFMRDRYTCYQETKTATSAAAVNQYGGAARSQVMPSCSAFNACLAARGYYRAADTANLDDFKQRGNYFVPAGAQVQCSL
jgi:hypothetical protein